MGNEPQLNAREVLRKLKNFGFEKDRQRGSHIVVRHPDGRSTTVPDHGNKPLRRGTLRAVIKQSGVDLEEFWKA
ncbi:MAG: type II toxin-antitoxin system HicA family toxin [Rhodopirellula sp. JB055]|uniref:type II toxin-antitoxin system HicA family toxin n=1 Tax=Rhodopirellula sp. JB055 TaxID=3342846 RepID=UPI00370A76AE